MLIRVQSYLLGKAQDIDAIEELIVPAEDIELANWKKNVMVLAEFKKELPEELRKKIVKAYRSSGQDDVGVCNIDFNDFSTDRHAVVIGNISECITRDEMRAMYAHEVSHVILGHTTDKSATVLGILNETAKAMLPITVKLHMMELLFSSEIDLRVHQFALLLIAINMLFADYSQRREFDADKRSISLSQNAPALISFLRKAESPNLSGSISEYLGSFFSTHPNTDARAKSLGISEEAIALPGVSFL